MKFSQIVLAGSIMMFTRASSELEEYKAQMKEKAAGMNGFVYDDRCAMICFFTPSCKNDPRSHGSYCKTGNSPSTCFGLYYKYPPFLTRMDESDESPEGVERRRRRYCFEPNDASCPEQFPVYCGGGYTDAPAVKETTVAIAETPAVVTTAPVVSSNTSQQGLEAFKADMKAKAVGMNGFFYDELCATLCYFTSTCRNDPQSHGSYCKTGNTPQTCFGLYFRSFLRLCFQPNDFTCPEQFPVLCGLWDTRTDALLTELTKQDEEGLLKA